MFNLSKTTHQRGVACYWKWCIQRFLMLGIPPMMGGFRALLIPPITDWWDSVVSKKTAKKSIYRFFAVVFFYGRRNLRFLRHQKFIFACFHLYLEIVFCSWSLFISFLILLFAYWFHYFFYNFLNAQTCSINH